MLRRPVQILLSRNLRAAANFVIPRLHGFPASSYQCSLPSLVQVSSRTYGMGRNEKEAAEKALEEATFQKAILFAELREDGEDNEELELRINRLLEEAKFERKAGRVPEFLPNYIHTKLLLSQHLKVDKAKVRVLADQITTEEEWKLTGIVIQTFLDRDTLFSTSELVSFLRAAERLEKLPDFIKTISDKKNRIFPESYVFRLIIEALGNQLDLGNLTMPVYTRQLSLLLNAMGLRRVTPDSKTTAAIITALFRCERGERAVSVYRHSPNHHSVPAVAQAMLAGLAEQPVDGIDVQQILEKVPETERAGMSL